MPNEKTTHEPGRLWGWPDAEAERAYAERIRDGFDEYPEFGEKKTKTMVACSQLIEYPDLHLQCVQTETWIRTEAGE